MDKNSLGITVKKSEDMASWYSQVCVKAELADYSAVKGSMVLRPNGFAIWQFIQDYFNKHIVKATNARNAYFPLFIPESFFKREAQHAKGFNPEVAWIDAELTKGGERLAVRPTSETIMYDSYSKWIRSYRDLPLKINQWANVVRWETQATKLFLRSREFLWQEGHCVYETQDECQSDTRNYIQLYAKLCKDLLALPVIVGEKTQKEKFAGALSTYTIEAFMPDGKALQCGTSHNLGQGFAKAFDIHFLGRDEKTHLPWQNSWGLSTRLIGGVVMTHSDDKGLVISPRIAENKIVIIPIFIGKLTDVVLNKAKELKELLGEFDPILDDRTEYKPGWKYNEWEMKGIPLRIEIGPRDVNKNQVVIVSRHDGKKDFVKIDYLKETIKSKLETMHDDLYKKAKSFLDDSIIEVNSFVEFEKLINENKLAKVNFCGDVSCEEQIKEKTQSSSRCLSIDQKPKVKSTCFHCDKPAKYIAYFSRSY